jgi:hypothetical protein
MAVTRGRLSSRWITRVAFRERRLAGLAMMATRSSQHASSASSRLPRPGHYGYSQLSTVRNRPLLAATATMSAATTRNAIDRLLC